LKNVILLTIDTLGKDVLRCYGSVKSKGSFLRTGRKILKEIYQEGEKGEEDT